MDPTTLATLLSAVPSLIKGIFGGSQLSQAKRLEEQNQRPMAEVAPAISKMVNYNRGLANAQDMPGGEIARNQIAGATSAGMNAATQLSSGSEGIGAANKMLSGAQGQYANIAKDIMQYISGKQGEYSNSLGTLAGEQNRVWDWNKAQPYLEAAKMASEFRDAGPKNIFSGISGMAGAAAARVAPDFNAAISKGGYGGSKEMPRIDDVMKIIQQYFPSINTSGGLQT